MARGQKGAGSVFQRTYRDAHGRLKRTKNWYIEYIVGGRTIREATKYGKRSDASEFLKKRVSDGLTGKIVLSNQVTFDDLKNLIVNDYRNNGRKSLPHLEQVRLPKLADVFAGMKTIDISTAVVERYKSLRLKDGAAPATLTRELAAPKRISRLGLRPGRAATVGARWQARSWGGRSGGAGGSWCRAGVSAGFSGRGGARMPSKWHACARSSRRRSSPPSHLTTA